MSSKLPPRPILLLTTHIAKTYNQIISAESEPMESASASADEKGYFIAFEDEVVNGYIIKKALGEGSFGRVVLVESPSKEILALKICRCTEYFIDAMKEEIEVLKMVNNECPEISVKLYDTFSIKNHLAVLMEYKDETLYQKLKLTGGRGFTLSEVKYFAEEFGYWLVQLEKIGIVHTDLKPENMVLSLNDNDVKLIDFGSAVILSEENRPSYIQSRFYRAPEITFSINYTNKLDAWSIGALLVELYTNYVMFPARSSFELCKMFISLLGLPDQKQILEEDSFGKLIVRPKVEKYFVLNTEERYLKREEIFEELKISPESEFIPTDDVLLVDDRLQCHPRNLAEIVQNGYKEGDNDKDLKNFEELVAHLLVYDEDARWGGNEILESKFCTE